MAPNLGPGLCPSSSANAQLHIIPNNKYVDQSAPKVLRCHALHCMVLQGLSVSELEAQMLTGGSAFSQPQQPQAHLPQPVQRPAQGVYNHGNSGLYSPSAAAALARLTQSAQQGHQPQPGVASTPHQRLSPMLQGNVLANQMQQRQGRSPGPSYAGRPGQSAAILAELSNSPREQVSWNSMPCVAWFCTHCTATQRMLAFDCNIKDQPSHFFTVTNPICRQW